MTIIKNSHNKILWLEYSALFLVLSLAIPLSPLWTINKLDLTKQLDLVNEGNLFRQTILLLLGSFSLLFLYVNKYRKTKLEGLLGWQIKAYMMLAVLSISWADDIFITSKRVIAFILLSISILAIAKYYTTKEIIIFMLFSCVATLLLGFIAEIALGTFNPFFPEHRFSGVFHANSQGQNCAVLLIISIMLIKEKKNIHLGYITISIIAFAFLILTKSRAAVLSGILTSLIGIFYYYKKALKGAAIVAYLMLLVILIVIIVYGVDVVMTFETKSIDLVTLGRQREEASWTFQDRRYLWRENAKFFLLKPVLGYGYGGFWNSNHIAVVSASIGRGFVANSHSTYFDMLLSLGIIGTLLFISILINATKKAIRIYKKYKNSEYIISAVLIIWLIIHSIFESLTVQPIIHSYGVYLLIVKFASLKEDAYLENG
jgi:exopolysaccharide production protein ExoQ